MLAKPGLADVTVGLLSWRSARVRRSGGFNFYIDEGWQWLMKA
jgi:hypothetical protein